MVNNIVLPTNDLAFKKTFANNQHKEILQGLIQDYYGIPIKELVIVNPYSIEEFNKALNKEGYYAVEVDSLCTTESNWRFTTEMQLHPQRFYPERSLYYLCSKYNASYGVPELMRGRSRYSALYPTFSINILGYNHFQHDQKAVRTFTLYDTQNQAAFTDPDLLTMGFFELHKPDLGDNRKLVNWQQLFLTGEVSSDAPDYIRAAADLLRIANFNREEREMIDIVEKIREDRIAQEEYAFYEGMMKGEIEGQKKGFQVGKREGIQEGIQEGIREGKQEGIREGKQEGLQEGLQKGLQRGKQEGILEGKYEMMINIIKELRLSVTKAMQIAELPNDCRDELIAHLEKNNIIYTL